MRKYLFIISAIIVAGCSNPEKQIREDVTAYLTSKYGGISIMEIESVTPIDSLYSPFEDYNSILLTYYDYVQKLREAADEVYKVATGPYYPNRIKDALKIKKDALEKYDDKVLRDLRQQAVISIMVPENPVLPKNRIGTKATLKMMGETTTIHFFYNRGDKTIGHCTIDMENRLKDIIEAKARYDAARTELIEL